MQIKCENSLKGPPLLLIAESSGFYPQLNFQYEGPRICSSKLLKEISIAE